MSLAWHSRAFAALAITAATFGAPARGFAARTYNIVNYPADQAGHTLTGFIKTTDDAPADGLLDLAEILDWEWSITGPNSYTTNPNSFLTNATAVNGVSISPSAITLPLAPAGSRTTNQLALSSTTDLGGRGSLGRMLFWSSASVPDAPPQHSYQALRIGGDVFHQMWGWPLSTASLGSSPWVIATAVPEPSAMTIATAAILGLLGSRRLAATKLAPRRPRVTDAFAFPSC